MKWFYILIGVVLLLDVLVISLYLYLGKHLPPADDDDQRFYDENGNHVYHDRKLIAHLEKQKQKENNSH